MSDQRRLIKARAWLLRGKTPGEAAKAAGCELQQAQAERAELLRRGLITEEVKPSGQKNVTICQQFSVTAASWILGVSERRLRAICLEGRLGQKLGGGRAYTIDLEGLTAFALLERGRGAAGVQARQLERETATQA
jgi:hypothetical protein